jgi:hypothetical protein
MRTALTSPSPELRFQAVAALAELAPEHASRDLLPLLNDPDPEVRGQVVAGLSSLDETHLAGHFAGALDDEDASVRLEALGGETPPIHVTLGARMTSATRAYEIDLETPESEREIRFKL